MYRIVLDTNIIDFAFLPEKSEVKEACQQVVFSIRYEHSGFKLAVDNGTEQDPNSFILREYRHNLGGTRDFEKYIMELFRKRRIEFVVLRQDIKLEERLYELKFHEQEDHVFVVTALAADRIIVTEDSDYGVHGERDYEKVYHYLTEELKLNLFTAEGFGCWAINRDIAFGGQNP